ncbi:MAG: putative DNA binding domain-containing protein [Ferruginibacter sp.]
MKSIEKILQRVENCIIKGEFEKIENDKLDFKDNSHSASEWKEVFKTACAFLNTGGGIIVLGIHEDEKEKKYIITGFNKTNEEKLKTIGQEFLNSKKEKDNFQEYITAYEEHEILGKNVLAIYIDQLPEDKKFIFYGENAYERKITGDHKVSVNKIQAQEEYKIELENARELQPVNNTTLSNLDVNKLNEYIHLLNKDIRTENIKPDIVSSTSFLLRKGFIDKNLSPTILGILVCGSNIEDLLGSRGQVDGYVDTGIQIAENKKVIKDNILPLMERSIAFISQNIKVAITSEAGGSSIPEYPIRLIRESVNNSLAHRDYGINKFININIIPGRYIEIRNPGRFKKQLLVEDIDNIIPIRRIIPGNSKANNPRLAEILKVFDKWEGKGLGMSTLTNECLSNSTDLPYYKFHSNDELSLIIQRGKLLDEKMESLIETYNGYIEKALNGDNITKEQKLVLSYFYKSEIENKNDRYTILLTKDNNHLDAINSLEDGRLIVKHTCSSSLYPVYVLDRNLFKKEFNVELRKLFGADFDALTVEARSVLTCIYEFNNYSKNKYPSANKIGDTLWKKAGKAHILNGFENFKRQVRMVVTQMQKRGILIRHENKPNYAVNMSFTIRQKSIYD